MVALMVPLVMSKSGRMVCAPALPAAASSSPAAHSAGHADPGSRPRPARRGAAPRGRSLRFTGGPGITFGCPSPRIVAAPLLEIDQGLRELLAGGAQMGVEHARGDRVAPLVAPIPRHAVDPRLAALAT